MKHTVNFLVLSDAANIDNFGKVNILGIFSKIFAEKVPATYGKFTIVGNLSFQNVDNKVISLEIKILDPKGHEVIMDKSVKSDILFPEIQNKKGDLNILIDIVNLKLESFGEYNVVVYLDSAEISRRVFQVDQKKVEAKQ